MLTFDATALAALASDQRSAVLLVEAEFTTGTQFLTNWPVPISADTGSGSGTQTYQPTSVVSFANIVNSEDPANEKMKITLPITSTAALNAAVGDATTYRNRAIRIYAQILNATHQPAGAPVLFYDGVMDKHSIERDRSGGSITLQCAKRGLSFVRRNLGLRMTDSQQQAEYPGDRFFEYVPTLVEKPAQWLSVDFQRQQ